MIKLLNSGRKLQAALRVLFTTVCLLAGSASVAFAYSCEGEFIIAQQLVSEAEALVTDETDARVLAMISEAKGIADGGIISHRKATEKHTGDVGKFMHSDSVRKGKWAQSLAKQAIFLLSGEIKG